MKSSKKNTKQVVSTKPMEPASNKNPESPLIGGIGNVKKPKNYGKGG